MGEAEREKAVCVALFGKTRLNGASLMQRKC